MWWWLLFFSVSLFLPSNKMSNMIKFEEGEKIMKVVRKHYFVLLPAVFMLSVLAVAPYFLYAFFTSTLFPIPASAAAQISLLVERWSVFAYSLWLLVLWIIFFIEWTNYYLDLWVITDKRILDVEQHGFFNREVTSFRFEQIQDITVETKGLIETFFHFGTLHIETAGHDRDIIIKDAHNPEDARSLILNIQLQNKTPSSI